MEIGTGRRLGAGRHSSMGLWEYNSHGAISPGSEISGMRERKEETQSRSQLHKLVNGVPYIFRRRCAHVRVIIYARRQLADPIRRLL